MLIDNLIEIIADYLEVDPDELRDDTDILYEYDLDEDQLEELAEIIEDETGEYVSADMIETNSVIEKLAKAIEEF
ncbi:phosphopantetheine-binding protein [Thomasclavelia cocleata]|uniref:phosphopantetheine-binding protein n=1 Tax=Thomasclavelia cocleata TaxID=69824 RepID=UPI00256F1BB0|nr:phosphopantetheine-binding protein [Thomasclavelia cocleata]